MSCPQCRFENPEGAAFCSSCGAALRAPAGAAAAGARRLKDGLARTSLILGLASLLLTLCVVGIATGPVAAVLGIVALWKANNSPAEYGGQGMAIGGIVTGVLTLLMVPVIAAIAIPSLLRARVTANEHAALEDIRSVLAAESGYAAQNGGLYDTPACLSAPRECIPDYPPHGPTFLEGSLLGSEPRLGYRREFHSGPAASPSERTGHSSTSLKAFAYVALPAISGRTGVRSFCGDATGRICALRGAPAAIEGGRCPADCTPVQP
jgi:hypothetical protein